MTRHSGESGKTKRAKRATQTQQLHQEYAEAMLPQGREGQHSADVQGPARVAETSTFGRDSLSNAHSQRPAQVR